MINFQCKNCGRKLRVQDSAAGKKGRCPQCKQTLVVPSPKSIASVKNNVSVKIDPKHAG